MLIFLLLLLVLRQGICNKVGLPEVGVLPPICVVSELVLLSPGLDLAEIAALMLDVPEELGVVSTVDWRHGKILVGKPLLS